MTQASGKGRTDEARRLIKASPQKIYRAMIDPEAWVAWLPPKGMKGRIAAFEARVGGAYRMTLVYDRQDHATPGKTSEHSDVVRGRFLELTPDKRIVQAVEFDSADPAFGGVMTMTWTLSAAAGGVEVAILCENVPGGIKPEDHAVGLSSTLDNLAAFTE